MGDMLYILFNLWIKKSINRLSEELGDKWGNVYHLAQDFKEYLAKKIRRYLNFKVKYEIGKMYIHAGSKFKKKVSKKKRRHS